MQVREAVRIRFQEAPTTTLFVGGRGEHPVDVVDLSRTGCAFEATPVEGLGEGARAHLLLPGWSRRARGSIRYVQEVPRGGGRRRYGVQFDRPLQPGRARARSPRPDVAGAEATPWNEAVSELLARERELEKARLLAGGAPPVREGLVTELWSRIRDGRYRVPGSQVLERMLQDHAEVLEIG